MIVREATDEDYKATALTLRVALKRLGYSGLTSAASVRRWIKNGARVFIALDGPIAVAVLVARPINTTSGDGFQVNVLVTDPTAKERLLALDSLVAFCCNYIISVGRPHVFTDRDLSHSTGHYARDLVGMTEQMRGRHSVTRVPAQAHHEGHARDILKTIFGRHPEWQLS